MAQAFLLKCDCGYEKEAQIGEGRMGMRLENIRTVFLEAELAEFEAVLKSGCTDYCYGRNLAYCRNCADIINSHVLRYAQGGITKQIIRPCGCGEALLPWDSNIFIKCPRCGGLMDAETTGYWD